MGKNDLAAIELQSGVNEEGNGFVQIMARSEGGNIFLGQVDPATCRSLGIQYLEAAEASETDAIVFRLLKDKFELPLPAIGAFITDMRNAREEPNG